jgi:ribosomal protein S18 acetylase RimI-like enzyme
MPAPPSTIEIRRFNGDAEAQAAAQIMALTDPWITLGRKFEHTIKSVTHPNWEVSVALDGGQVIGVILVGVNIPLVNGYIAGLAVAKDHRNRGVGAQLLAHAEQRILAQSPNVFLTVSSFNKDAQRFYERHGYQKVGDLTDYAIPGNAEILMRKTTGPWRDFETKK